LKETAFMTPGNRNTGYFESLEQAGITGHYGGVGATQRLVDMLNIKAGQRVLDLGCGTAYTATSLARLYPVEVVAVDLRMHILNWAKRRVLWEGAEAIVWLSAADAHSLPFTSGSFDVVVTESLLVFCDPERVAAEIFRVLKPGGRFGCNENTLVKPLPDGLKAVLNQESGVEIVLYDNDQWRRTFQRAGFEQVTGNVRAASWFEVSLFTPIRTAGIRKYFKALWQSLSRSKERRSLGSQGLLRSTHYSNRLVSYLGHGLYTGQKPKEH
jgi:ubiquinone/menaquinone biosynthesis C-methylase UbiE